jgi:hypothetical protein
MASMFFRRKNYRYPTVAPSEAQNGDWEVAVQSFERFLEQTDAQALEDCIAACHTLLAGDLANVREL